MSNGVQTQAGLAGCEQYLAAARAARSPEDQVRNFIAARVLLQPKQLAASAAARLCDRESGPTAVGYGGARGGGKSHWLLAQMGADDCQRVRELKCLLLRKVGKVTPFTPSAQGSPKGEGRGEGACERSWARQFPRGRRFALRIGGPEPSPDRQSSPGPLHSKFAHTGTLRVGPHPSERQPNDFRMNSALMQKSGPALRAQPRAAQGRLRR